MDKILKYLFLLSFLSMILGPLLPLPLEIPGVNIYLSDVFIGLNAFFWLFNFPYLLTIIKKDKISKIFFLFAGTSFLSLIFTPIILTIPERIISGLYLVRLVAYFSLYITILYLINQKIIKQETIIKSLIVVGIILGILGWLQYFLYPDLRNLYYLGWDPHFKRIFSTFLDPNYFGLMMVLTICTLLSSYSNWFLAVFTFITLLFTYSRSSFISLISAVIFYSLSKRKYFLILATFIVFGIGTILLPRPAGEGVKLERIFSIEERIKSWKEGIRIFSDHPILGVGFNTLRYAKKEYGFLSFDWQTNHAASGIENSYIFLLATTGIIGLVLYLYLVINIIQTGSLLTRLSIVAIFTHALFLNSLFFPPVMLWFWLISANKKRVKI